MLTDPNRRDVLRTGGLLLAGVAASAASALSTHAGNGIIDIAMRSDIDGAKVWFDPIGLLVPLHTTLRWTIFENVHTATAYHPDNDNHAQRIPHGAPAWDSGYLVNPGDTFAVTLSVPGVYDYYCAPHEFGGMVGRNIVGDPARWSAAPYDDASQTNPDWEDVPELAQAAFPSVQSIVQNGQVRIEG